jgi:hypothetical protein
MFADPLIGWLVAFFGSHKLGIVSEKSPLNHAHAGTKTSNHADSRAAL